MNWWLIIIIPVTSAFIGWITIRMAITMLFRPQKPVRVIGFTIQGVFHKRQLQFAEQLGELVSREFLSFSDIEEKITSADNIKKIMPVAEQHVDEFLRKKLGEAFPMIGMFIGEKTINQLKTLFMNELETIFPVIIKGYVQNLQQELDLKQIVTSKVAAFSIDKLETNLYQSMGNELRAVHLLGAGIGLVMGLIQLLMIIVLS
jgi:uncharacterized membrane protein YheB (UPF0754 family)